MAHSDAVWASRAPGRELVPIHSLIARLLHGWVQELLFLKEHFMEPKGVQKMWYNYGVGVNVLVACSDLTRIEYPVAELTDVLICYTTFHQTIAI